MRHSSASIGLDWCNQRTADRSRCPDLIFTLNLTTEHCVPLEAVTALYTLCASLQQFVLTGAAIHTLFGITTLA